MTIRYDAVQTDKRSTAKISPALQNLVAINESFQKQGISVLAEGHVEIASNAHFFQDYMSKLTEGMDSVLAEEFEILAENARKEILAESTISGITPVTAYSFPLLRSAYPKTCVREGLPTEPVTMPRFTVSWNRPHVIDTATGIKQYLPKALRTTEGFNLFSLPKLVESVTLSGNARIGYDLLTGMVGASHIPNGDEIDPQFRIKEVTVSVPNLGAGVTAVVVPVDFRLDTGTNLVDGLITATSGTGVTSVLRLFGKVDREFCTADFVVAHISTTGADAAEEGSVTSIKIEGFLSSENNARATQIGFTVTQDATVIGTGQPIESPINIQQMTDTMAMYNIDTTVQHLEIMSKTLAQIVDIEGINFLIGNFTRLPGSQQTALTDTFDLTPPANYNQGPTAWRDEMKLKIDLLIIKMMDDTNITSGQVVIFGNPYDVQNLHNVRWMYTDQETPNGVNIDYKLGTYTSGVTTYKVMSSFNFPKGALFFVFLPDTQDQKTVVYYPYSYHVIRGQNSTTANLAAIQMIKRQAFKEYTPMIAKLVLTQS